LTTVVVPPVEVEAARELMRSHDACRRDLMTARHRLTKTGSGFARRLLVESAWHYGRDPRIGVTLRNRQQGQPDHVLQIANRAQHRLHRVYHRMRSRGKAHNVTVVACARELTCFLWAAATAD
jgi:transposase